MEVNQRNQNSGNMRLGHTVFVEHVCVICVLYFPHWMIYLGRVVCTVGTDTVLRNILFYCVNKGHASLKQEFNFTSIQH